MKFNKIAKVVLTGLGLTIAASAYAVTCQQCANRFDDCLMEENGARQCLIEFRRCVSASGTNCQMN
ncbi:hypothetical protein [Shewanella sp. 10N.286.54.B9]|uniref:hypothetical protein n=1 Tax=Shewanella sp. 10N.286.54.B9 TaxID=3229719 RepID=UPI0035501C8E